MPDEPRDMDAIMREAGRLRRQQDRERGGSTLGGTISISSGYGEVKRQPFVQLVWGERVAQLTPAEARAHALRILEVAAAAEADAFLVDWTVETVLASPSRMPVTDDQKRTAAAQIMAAFRAWRRRRETP